jgi:CheY-like chemotaxis protein
VEFIAQFEPGLLLASNLLVARRDLRVWVPLRLPSSDLPWKGDGIRTSTHDLLDSPIESRHTLHTLCGSTQAFAVDKICQFLIVEDNRDEAFLIERALQKMPVETGCVLCRNINEAKDYLRGAGMYADRVKFPEADIVVSDLKVGLESGLALLEWVKGREDSKKIHFIILTGSATSSDLNVAIEKGAAQVVQKPFELASLIEIMSDFVRLYCP